MDLHSGTFRTFVGGLAGTQNATLREILNILRETYCGTIGVELMNIQDQARNNGFR
jgi:2-oxoglutarate dehydrogenase E1 component